MLSKKKSILFLNVVAVTATLGITSAYAANCKDTVWELSYWENTDYTSVRDKDTTTSLYTSTYHNDNKSYVEFHAVNSLNKRIPAPSGASDPSEGASFSGTGQLLVRNWVREQGYESCALSISRTPFFQHGVVDGVWSPDFCAY